MKIPAILLLALVAAGGFSNPLDEGKTAFGRQDWKGAAALLGRFVQENPDDAEAPTAAFLRGVALYQLADYRGSLDAFQKMDRAWPRSAYFQRLPYWKGTAALGAGQHLVAERELTAQARYPDAEPFTTRALLNLALARVALGKGPEAREALQAFTQASKEPVLLSQAWAVWGDEEKKAGRLEEALARYRRAWEANPGDRWDLSARTQAVDLLLNMGRLDEAWELLETSDVRFPKELDRWDARRVLVAKGQGNLEVLLVVLERRWNREPDLRKKQELALNRARSAEDAGAPDSAWWLRASQGPDGTLGGPAILRYAFLEESSGRTAGAAQALETWVKDHATAPAALREAALDRAALNRLTLSDAAGARKVWDRLIADYSKSAKMPAWLLARGRLAHGAGDSTRALLDFNRLLKDYPKAAEGPEARYQTGLVYLARQEPARAEAWFYGVVQELKSGDLYQRALLARGVCFVNSGQTDLARGSLQRLIREVPNGVWTGEAWAALGRNALQARRFAEAVEAYALAEQTLPEPAARARALWSLAEAQVGAGAVNEASAAFARYSQSYPDQPQAAQSRYRQGAVYFSAKDWQRAFNTWSLVVSDLKGDALALTREGMATALLRLDRPQEGWNQLLALEAVLPSPEAWYRWGQAATALGLSDWAVQAFQELLQRHPASAVAEAALPRAAGALLSGGKADQALSRYAEYFRKFGRQSSSAPVARAAAAAALPFPQTLEALFTASRDWNLAPEVATEFALAWALSRLDSDTDTARAELEELSRTAPWTSQRSEALAIVGRWHLGRGMTSEARTALEAASNLGDDLSMFKARWALAQVTEKEGDKVAAARQRESAEKAAGPGVPLEFRVQVLKEAAEAWNQAGRGDDAARVKKRIDALGSN